LSKQQLISFFDFVKRGRFLKGITWPWLDEIRGFTGNQVIDNLLHLASIYQKELNLTEIEKIAQRILDYDDLNEEAIYLQVWALQKTNNINLARFNFGSFAKKYESSFGEPYPMNFCNLTSTLKKVLFIELSNTFLQKIAGVIIFINNFTIPNYNIQINVSWSKFWRCPVTTHLIFNSF
jgi:hypothetical protein